ncbi:hypothetical protein GHA28_002229, partial [Neisseria gonorrhoeae]
YTRAQVSEAILLAEGQKKVKNQPLPGIARITAYGRKTSSFPRKRESRSVGTETYRVKRFLRS